MSFYPEADLSGTIARLFVYPVKSCAGIEVQQARLTEAGLELDRAWMVVDDQGMFLTQRSLPRMALIRPQLVADGMVLLYPQPTLFNKVVFVATTDRSKKLGELLATDAELQHLAVDFGFRVADSAYFAQVVKSVGLTVDEHITQVIDPPSFELMGQMIDAMTQGMAQ